MTDVNERHRLVFLGSGAVGKSSIVKRFLTNTFTNHYKETVEDLYCREYVVEGTKIKVDILDTAGNFAFPAMRRLSISTGHAFVLVYSINNYPSFQEVQTLREQIKEERENFDDLPCVVVGNKCDLDRERQVPKEDAIRWVYDCGLNGAFVEVSAKDGENILDIFKTLLGQVKQPNMKMLEPILQRRLSANSVEQLDEVAEEEASKSTKDKSKFFRSRSLIRRSSKPRVKRNARRVGDNAGDCLIS